MTPSPRRDLRRVVINALTGGLVDQLDRIEERTNMAVTQGDLDNLAAQLVEDHGEIQQQITKLEQDIADGNDLDLSGLRTAVGRIGELVPSNTGGGEGPVSEDSNAPIVAGDPAASGDDQPTQADSEA